MHRKLFPAALLLGAVIRTAALLLPGTHDVDIWKIWTYAAATRGATDVYGVGGSPPERRVIDFHGAETTVDYPPLALYELGAVGRVYRGLAGQAFPDTIALTAAIKGLIVLAEIGLTVLTYAAVRRAATVEVARWSALAYWLNPAALLDGSVLGYLDPLFVLPASAALVATVSRWPLLAGALGAAAVLTKAQAIVLTPALAVAICAVRPARDAMRGLLSAATGAAIVSIAVVGPVVAAGAWPNLVQAMSQLATHDMLSANACNVWWIATYLLRTAYAVHDKGIWIAFTTPTRILGISRAVELGYPNARTVGIVLTVAAMAWAVWTARRARDLWLTAALGAFLVHSYATLSAQVHENHLFAAVPLLAVAAAGRRRLIPVFVVVSAIFALNLNIFYGISEGIGYAIPRDVTIIDLSVVLSVANCAALAWHASIFSRECSTADAHRQSRVPA